MSAQLAISIDPLTSCIQYILTRGQRKKSFIVAVGVLTIFNGVFSSSLPSGAINYMADYFDISDRTQLVLPITVYQLGFVMGSLLNGPLSETYGRRAIMLGPFGLFCISAAPWPQVGRHFWFFDSSVEQVLRVRSQSQVVFMQISMTIP